MEHHDPDPHRRNLVVTSLAFILYYLGCGTFVDDQYRLLVANIRFDHPDVLKYFTWVMLFWFLIRYRQTRPYPLESSKVKLRTEIKDLINGNQPPTLVVYFMESKIKGRFRMENGFSFFGFDNYILPSEVQYHVLDKMGHQAGQGPLSLSISKFWTLVLSTNCLFSAFINRTEISEYMVPYILFGFALLIPASEWLYSSLAPLF